MARFATILLILIAGCASPKPVEPEPAPETPANEMSSGASYVRGMELRDKSRMDEALPHMRSAAERGHAEAQFELGYWYLSGRGVEEDPREAAKWIGRAAEQGQVDALIYNWQLHYYGKGVRKDDRKAFQWLQRAVAVDEDNAVLSYYLGLFYYEGIATDANPEEAAIWFKEAAEGDVPEAWYHLGVMHMEGDGVEQDDDKAFAYFKRGEGHGVRFDLALGDMYRDGRGTPASMGKAKEHYRKAADQKEDEEVRDAGQKRLEELRADAD